MTIKLKSVTSLNNEKRVVKTWLTLIVSHFMERMIN